MNGSVACDTTASPAAVFPTLPTAPSERGEQAGTSTDLHQSFEDLLGGAESEIPSDEEPAAEQANDEASTIAPLPFFAFFSPPPQILLAQNVAITPGETATEPCLAATSDGQPREKLSAGIDPAALMEQEMPENEEGAGNSSQAEHKFPATSSAPGSAPEQIAAKGRALSPESNGMPAAQQPAMVFTTSHNEDERGAADQSQALAFEYQETAAEPAKVEFSEPAQRPARRAATTDFNSVPELAQADARPARLDRESANLDSMPAPGVNRFAEKTIADISGHIQLLRSTGQDRLEVVLKPDNATAIHLEVARIDGQIQVQARCERGHFASLDAQWSAVQNALAAQGIRVEPLQAGSAASFTTGQFGQPQQQNRQQDRSEPPISFEQDMPHSSPSSPGQPDSRARRGWQRWA